MRLTYANMNISIGKQSLIKSEVKVVVSRKNNASIEADMILLLFEK